MLPVVRWFVWGEAAESSTTSIVAQFNASDACNFDAVTRLPATTTLHRTKQFNMDNQQAIQSETEVEFVLLTPCRAITVLKQPSYTSSPLALERHWFPLLGHGPVYTSAIPKDQAYEMFDSYLSSDGIAHIFGSQCWAAKDRPQ